MPHRADATFAYDDDDQQQPPTPLPVHYGRGRQRRRERQGLLSAVKRRLLSSNHKPIATYGSLPMHEDDIDNDDEGRKLLPTSPTTSDIVLLRNSTDVTTGAGTTNGIPTSTTTFILHQAEFVMRYSLLVILVFWGTSQWLGAARPIVYLTIAWLTTLCLRALTLYTQWKEEQRMLVLMDVEQHAGGGEEEEDQVTTTTVAEQQQQQHQEQRSSPLCMVDTATTAQIVPGTLCTISNDYFHGTMMWLLPPNDHFRNKQRRFEFQFQIQLSQLPPNDTVYFSCGVPAPVASFALWQRMVVQTAVALCPGVVYTPGQRMAFGLGQGMDRRIATPTSAMSPPPALGGDLPPSNLDPKFVWELDTVYTFALWSKYVDFGAWECRNIPGVRALGLHQLLGRQPLYLSVFCQDHAPMLELEVSHQVYTGWGEAAQRHWDTAMVGDWSLAQGIYVRSGEWWYWQQQEQGGAYVGNGGGFCILNPTPSKVCIENRQQSLLQNGDTVTVKLAEENGGIKYLTIHRGWWLKWVSVAPTMNGYFTIHFDSDYLTVGGSFSLRHKRWSAYRVGVASEGSATYGGRLLGLHEERDDWMQQLQFCVLDPTAKDVLPQQTETTGDNEESVHLVFSEQQHRMDVPAYIEVMNRQSRVLQYAFVVRVSTAGWVRLRTGRDLARVMQQGYAAIASAPPSTQSSPRHIAPTGSFENSTAGEPSDDDWDAESEDFLLYDSFDESMEAVKPTPRKGRKFIGKIARSVKSTTTNAARSTGNAGKLVVSQSVKGTVNAGKATVNVGKAIIPIRPKRPPAREPKSAKRRSKRQQSNDLRMNARSIKRAESVAVAPGFSSLAGELSASEQSCRTVSSQVARMSAEPEGSTLSLKLSNLLASLVETEEDRDKKFLLGGAVDVGVTPQHNGESLVLEALVARCLWESHWREEWCGIYESGLVFYAPLATEHCLDLRWDEVKTLRAIEDDSNQLAGHALLVIETEWMCHYCAFMDTNVRQEMWDSIEEQMGKQSTDDGTLSSEERFLHEFNLYAEACRSIGSAKWARVSSGSKSKSRVVLNSRRMAFDMDGPITDAATFSEELLVKALSMSLDSQVELLCEFLDCASYLKSISLNQLDPDTPETFCFFVNVYHCLLQHAMLFSVNGPLHKKSFRHFMRTSCYEIGQDVFSLAELYCFVVRGNMSRSPMSRPPFMDAPRKSESFRGYALGFRMAESNLLLTTADLSFPNTVPVLNPVELIDQIELQTGLFLRKNVVVDDSRKLIILPKILDVYKTDFFPDSGASNIDVVRYISGYLDEISQETVRRLLEDEPNSIVVRYQFPTEKFCSRLRQDGSQSGEELGFGR